jgi:hypothetical protein
VLWNSFSIAINCKLGDSPRFLGRAPCLKWTFRPMAGRRRTGSHSWQFRTKDDPSHYMKLITSRREQVLWGKDIKRALQHGQTRPDKDELVGARRLRRASVTITTHSSGPDGTVTTNVNRIDHKFLTHGSFVQQVAAPCSAQTARTQWLRMTPDACGRQLKPQRL